MTIEEILQMAVDYYLLNVKNFEDKYPIRPPEGKDLPFQKNLVY